MLKKPEMKESLSANKRNWEKQLWYLSPEQSRTEAGLKQFFASLRRNGSFQQADSMIRPEELPVETPSKPTLVKLPEQFTPLMKKSPSRNQTTYEILNQIYELQHRKKRNQSLLDELMRKTKQANDILTFQRIVQRKRYVKRTQRCQSVIQKDQEIDQVKGQMIQVRAIVHQLRKDKESPKSPKRDKLLPQLTKVTSPPKEIKRESPVKRKALVDDLRFWDAGFNRIMQNPSYLESNQLINFTNGLQVIPASHQKYYKIYVGRGNNHMLVKSMFNMRSGWSTANTLEDEVNFIWTQKFIDLAPSELRVVKKPEVLSEMVDGFIDSSDMVLLKQAWDKVEGRTKKKLIEYNMDAIPILQNLQTVKELTVINHQSQQIVIHNHLREGNQLGDKKNLFLNMQRYCSEWDIDICSILPLTYHICSVGDNEYSVFLSTFNQMQQDQELKNIWIVKPGEDTNRGNGIKVTNSLAEITNQISQSGHTFIVQKYMEKPFLYNRRKFDIRGYCLITVMNGIKKVFWYKRGYIRTSSSTFSLDNLESQKIHLTNDAIQNRLSGYGKFEKGNKVSYEQFQQYLSELNKANGTTHNFEDLYLQMKQITKMATRASIDHINNSEQFVGFELYGLDFMVSHDFKPVLIEFNTNPCIETGCPILTKIISNLMDNLVRFIIEPLFPAKRTGNEDFNLKNNFELLLQC